jgi:RNA polymerase sigma-70 factor (ECF subfamily)
MSLKQEMLALVPKLRAHAWVLSRGAPDADHLVHETLSRAWQNRDSLEPGVNLKTWMFRILRSVHLASLAGEPAGEADPAWRARFGALLDALAQLPEQNCEALLLVAGSGLSYEEAAEVCYCSAASIHARVSRAREQLNELIGAEHIASPAQAEPEPAPTP